MGAQILLHIPWLPDCEGTSANALPLVGLSPTHTHLGTTGQEFLPRGEVLSADNLPREHSVAQEVMIGV